MITQCPKTGRTCELTGCSGCWKDSTTQDEIIRMAREAGFTEYGSIGYVGMEDYLERFAEIVAAHEREACAKVAAGYDATPWKHCQSSAHAADMVSASIAAAIRSRNVDSLDISTERVEKTAESIHDCGGAQHHRYAGQFHD